MTGPPPARSQPIRTLLPSLQKIVWFQSCCGENDTLYLPEPEPNRSRQVVCRSAEICHSGENKKSTEACGFKPRWHGLYSQPHCFKYVFSWLNKEKKKSLIVLSESSEMLFFGISLWGLWGTCTLLPPDIHVDMSDGHTYFTRRAVGRLPMTSKILLSLLFLHPCFSSSMEAFG